MSEQNRGQASDPDGVRVVASSSGAGHGRTLLLQGLGLFFVAAGLGWFLMPRSAPPRTASVPPVQRPPDVVDAALAEAIAQGDGPPPVATAAAGDGSAASPAAPASKRSVIPRRVASKRPNPDANAADGDPDQQPELVGIPRDVTAGEYIERLHEMGIYEGIGAFNPPGTSPPLEGLAVPEDYELPEGYVRHYQATDDGQAIEPILMFGDPELYEFTDDQGNPIQIPEDRVVPPDMAPPGFPIRKIEIPPPREPGDLSR